MLPRSTFKKFTKPTTRVGNPRSSGGNRQVVVTQEILDTFSVFVYSAQSCRQKLKAVQQPGFSADQVGFQPIA
jgi:hypothetical protein